MQGMGGRETRPPFFYRRRGRRGRAGPRPLGSRVGDFGGQRTCSHPVMFCRVLGAPGFNGSRQRGHTSRSGIV